MKKIPSILDFLIKFTTTILFIILSVAYYGFDKQPDNNTLLIFLFLILIKVYAWTGKDSQ